MTSNILQIRQPSFYHRNSQNDALDKKEYSDNLPLRVCYAAVPILNLIKPLGRVFQSYSQVLRTSKNLGEAITSFSARKYSDFSKDILNISLSIASLVGTIFANPFGLFISTFHDIGLNSYECLKLLSGNKPYTKGELLKQITNVATSSLYLVAMFYGCLEIQVATLGILLVTELISSVNEYKKGDYIELASHLIMSLARACQLVPQVKNLNKKWAFEKEMKAYLSHLNRIYVGDLKDKWQFPSDHLPVASEIDGTKIISWNVLNDAYMDWVYNDSQGLKGSMLTQLDVPVTDKKGLTQRDLVVIDMIKSMVNKNNGLISLQECGNPFLDELEKHLPKNWQLIRSTQKPIEDQNVILFNKNNLNYNSKESTISSDGFPTNPGRTIMNCSFERTDGKNFRIFNSHLPGDPSLPGRYEFCDYLKKHSKENEIAVAMGDMNFEKFEMQEACDKQGLNATVVSPKYGTNVDPCKEAKVIDHFIVTGTKNICTLCAEQVLSGLEKIASLIPVLN